MNTTATLLEILKYIIPALVVMITSAVIVKNFLMTDLRRKQAEMIRDNQEITVRLRLQAYERMALFIERIHPRQLVPRVYEAGMTVSDLKHALYFTIKTEFEHNLAQQIYVSKPVWDTVRTVKEQELNMINHIAAQLQPDAPAKELHTKIVDYVLTTDGELPTEVALKLIHEEAKRILSFGAQD
jgi:hypothetical protein